jgi:ATP-dependent RNA helicase RhlB
LAVQIHRDAELIGRHTGFRLGLVYGGTGYQQQRDQVAAGVDILIGTPGRLIDYFKQRVFDFKSVEVVVLDEADRMFDLGFIKDIRFVLRRMPPPTERLGMLFSATLSYRVTELAYEHMNQPRMVEIEPEKVTADRVRQSCYMVANDEKVRLLIGLIRGFDDARIMIFINTKREGEWVWGFLEGNGLKSAMLSGDVPQKKRLSLLRQFQAGELPIMVATDVAARGLHIPGVTHVINYDLPEDAEDYVHRIGRTARAGEAGDAISFVCETYAFCLPDIERYIGSKIEVSPVSESMLADIDYRSRVRVPRRPREDRGAAQVRVQARARNGAVGPTIAPRAGSPRAASALKEPIPADDEASERRQRGAWRACENTRSAQPRAAASPPPNGADGLAKQCLNRAGACCSRSPRRSQRAASPLPMASSAPSPQTRQAFGAIKPIAAAGFKARHGRKLVDALGRLAGIRLGDRQQPAKAVGAGRAQHVQVVIDEQGACRVEGLDLLDAFPETRRLLGQFQVVGADDALKVSAEAGTLHLQRNGLLMGVGHQHAALAASAQASRKSITNGCTDQVIDLGLQQRDVES